MCACLALATCALSCWKETLLGLSSLVHHRALTSSDAVTVCRGIFDNVAVQSLTQSGRKLALDMLLAIAQTRPTGTTTTASNTRSAHTTRTD